MKTLRYLILAAALAAAACGDDDSKPTPDGAVTRGDGGADAASPQPDGGAPMADGGMTNPDGGPAPLTLVGWVSDLVEHYTTPTADPDTVDDKKVQDTDDPAAFDKLLGQ